MLRHRLFVLAALLVCVTGLVWASDKAPVTSNAKLFNALESETRIMSDIYYLTSDECEGRGSTTAGIHKAADYIVSRLKQAGLQPAGVNGTYFQPYEFKMAGTRLGTSNELKFTAGGDSIDCTKETMQVLGAGNAGTLSNAGVVFVGYGLSSDEPAYNDYEGQNVEGKVVIIIRKAPRQDEKKSPNFKDKDAVMTLNQKINTALEKKVAAIIFVNDAAADKDGDKLPGFNVAGTSAKKNAPPVFQVKRTVVNDLLKKAGLEALGAIEEKIETDFKPASAVLKDVTVSLKSDINRDPLKINNIIATVPGAGELADEVVVVGSHYDHVGRGETGSLARSKEIHHGADDNASGSCCNLEIARRWHELQSGPNASKNRRRVVFQWYSAEEWGLIGSDYYTKNPLFPLEKTASMLNLDMVGRLGFDENKVPKGGDAAEYAAKKYPLEVLGTTSAAEFEGLVMDANKDLGVELTCSKSSQFFSASDHFSFYKKNIPVIFFFTGMHPQYHRPTDVWQTINIKGIRQCAELGQNILEKLVAMPRPQFVKATAPQPRRTQGVTPDKTPAAPAKKPEAPKKEEKKDPHSGDATPEVGRVTVPRMGIQFNYNDEGPGVLVDVVNADRPGAKAGLKSGDRIIEINGKKISKMSDNNSPDDPTLYMNVMGKFKPGQELNLVVERKGAPDKLKFKVIGE